MTATLNALRNSTVYAVKIESSRSGNSAYWRLFGISRKDCTLVEVTATILELTGTVSSHPLGAILHEDGPNGRMRLYTALKRILGDELLLLYV